MKTVIAYMRVSKDEQHLSFHAQRTAINRWAAAEGLKIRCFYSDSVCSATPVDKRPGLAAALAEVSENTVLVVAKRDRLARDILLAVSIDRQVQRCGGVVISTAGEGNGSDPAAEFMRTVIDGAAQYELSLIRARTKAALGSLKAQGRVYGKAPWGFEATADGHLRPSAREQAATAFAVSCHEAGPRTSLQAIGDLLAAHGFYGRAGRPFQAQQVKNMLAAAALSKRCLVST